MTLSLSQDSVAADQWEVRASAPRSGERLLPSRDSRILAEPQRSFDGAPRRGFRVTIVTLADTDPGQARMFGSVAFASPYFSPSHPQRKSKITASRKLLLKVRPGARGQGVGTRDEPWQPRVLRGGSDQLQGGKPGQADGLASLW